jgi:hypothetical protein
MRPLVRPGVLCIALIASAAFIIVAVDSFRHRGEAMVLNRKSATAVPITGPIAASLVQIRIRALAGGVKLRDSRYCC